MTKHNIKIGSLVEHTVSKAIGVVTEIMEKEYWMKDDLCYIFWLCDTRQTEDVCFPKELSILY